ncbi:MAG: hypothetical protein K6G53_03490 [Bacteroidales bacterium]|nr:hypothetical protein [Bacteroidales bacterium]
MKRFYTVLLSITSLLMLHGCGTMALLPVQIDEKSHLDSYKYFYINATGSTTSRSNVGVNVGYGVYVTDSDKTVNPGDFISGYLIKKGYIRVAEMPFLYPNDTFIVNYGEGDRRKGNTIIDQYAQEVILQFISAKNNEVICTIKGEGSGYTQAEEIHNALQRCLDSYFE